LLLFVSPGKRECWYWRKLDGDNMDIFDKKGIKPMLIAGLLELVVVK
jgi:hypothetical protein